MTTVASNAGSPAVSGPDEVPERSDFLPYLARKVGAACVSFFMLLVVGFVIFSLMPADPVSALTRGRPTSDAQMTHLRQELGLDQPLWQRFLTFVGHTLTGNLGYSYEYHQTRLLADRRPDLADDAADGHLDPDLHLAGHVARDPVRLAPRQRARPECQRGLAGAVVGADLLAGTDPAGAVRQRLGRRHPGDLPGGRHADARGRRAASTRAHIPDVAWHLVLPCLTLVAVIFAQYVTIMRSSIIDERGNPYLMTARAKGLRDEVVRRRHAVPNALLPSVTVIFLQIGGDDRRRHHRRGRLLLAGPRLPHLHRRCASPTCSCSRGRSSSSARR